MYIVLTVCAEREALNFTLLASITASSGIRVSLIRARGLGVKNTESKLKGWLLTTTIPKIYVTVRAPRLYSSTRDSKLHVKFVVL